MLQILVNEFKHKWNENKCDKLYYELQQSYLKKYSNLKSLTKYDIIILASIIDDLVDLDNVDIMPDVARVYYNRIVRPERLYLTSKDQFINRCTRTNYGLPPRPLNNPGIQAILAALRPGNHKYINLKDIGVR